MAEAKKSSTFTAGKILRFYVLLLLVVVLGITGVLWAKLSAYQKSLTTAQSSQTDTPIYETLEAWRASATTGAELAEKWFETYPNTDESPAHAAEFFSGLLADGATGIYSEAGSTEHEKHFILANNGNMIARICLEMGNTPRISAVELLWKGEAEVKVCGPVDSALCLAGETIEKAPDGISSAVPENAVKPFCTEERKVACWKLKEMTTSGDIRAAAPAGAEISTDGFMIRDDRVAQICRQRAVDFTRSYLRYYMSGEVNTEKNLSEVLALVGADTTAAQLLQETMDGVSWNHSYEGIDVADVAAGPAAEIAENCFFVDAEYQAGYTENGERKEYGSGVFRVYFLNTPGRGYEICYFERQQG